MTKLITHVTEYNIWLRESNAIVFANTFNLNWNYLGTFAITVYATLIVQIVIDLSSWLNDGNFMRRAGKLLTKRRFKMNDMTAPLFAAPRIIALEKTFDLNQPSKNRSNHCSGDHSTLIVLLRLTESKALLSCGSTMLVFVPLTLNWCIRNQSVGTSLPNCYRATKLKKDQFSFLTNLSVRAENSD